MKIMEGQVSKVPQLILTDELSNLIPHKGKMFLLSRITEHNLEERTATGEYDITSGCIFYEDALDGIPDWSVFEIMAQTISAFGSIERIENDRMDKANPGVILSVSNFKSSVAVLKKNTTIKIKIREDCRMDDVTRYECSVFQSSRETDPDISAMITVMEMKDMSAFFGI